MKHKITFFAVVIVALAIPHSVKAYDFSVTVPSGQTLYFNYESEVSGGSVYVTYPNSSSNPYSGYTKPTGNLTIPSSVTYNGNTYSVTDIGIDAFAYCSGLTSVTIGNSVTTIGDRAFYNCSGLTSVTIPNSVTSIGNGVFVDCIGLLSISVAQDNTTYDSRDNCNAIIETATNTLIRGCQNTVIPNSVTTIGGGAFAYCIGLTSVTIPNSVTSIGEGAFSDCIGLTSVTIPTSVTSIGDYAFYGCSGLTSVTIPTSVTSIEMYAFYGCSGLTSIVVDAGNTHYDSRDGCNAIIQTDLNLLVQGCSSTVIPSSVTAIGNFAFTGCSGLTSVTIPNSVTSIGYAAFAGCSGLTSVTIPTSVTSIGNYAFEACIGLTSVTIPNSVTSIGEGAFINCIVLTSVTIPTSVTSIGANAFDYCHHLNAVFCESITPPTLGSNAFLTYYGNIYVPCSSISAYVGNWRDYSSRIQGTPYLEYTTSFASNNDTMGTINVGVTNCDSNITVTAVSNNGFQLVGWSDGGTGNPRTIHLIGDTTVTALFDYITYAVAGQPANTAQGMVSGSDTVYYGETVTLTAMPNYGYHFTRWNDYNTDNPRTVTATTDVNYTAYFSPNNYTITLQSSDDAQGYVGGGGTTTYLNTRYIYATPSTGYHFSHWSDGDSNASRTITVTQDSNLTAYFEINSYQLTVLPNDPMLGSVTGGGTYTHGNQVTVTATPVQGNRFDRWSDNTLLASHTFTITSDMQLVAVFVPVDTVHVHDTTYVNVHDTTYVDVHDTTYIDVPYAVHDTTYIYVPYAVHDTTYIDVHDTTYIDVPYAVHDTTYVEVFVHDTTVVVDTLTLTELVPVLDTTIQRDTIYLPVYLHDTTLVAVHDTTVITDTLTLTEYVPVHDTTYIDVHDTTYIDVPYAVHDTMYIDVFVHDTTYIDVHDTTYIDVPYAVHDTTIVTLTDTIINTVYDTVINTFVDTVTNTEYVYDTVTNTIYDTVTNTVYDTVDNYIYDTTIVTDTLWLMLHDTIYLPLYLHDTVYIHDTVYVPQEGIDGVVTLNAKVYSSDGQIVVEGAEGNTVWLYDVSGRLMATRRDDGTPLCFDAPASGTYMIKIGNHPARKVVVIR